MTALEEEVERLVPSSNDWPLVRGILIGATVGAVVVGIVVAVRTLQSRRTARRRPPPAGSPPPTSQPSPL